MDLNDTRFSSSSSYVVVPTFELAKIDSNCQRTNENDHVRKSIKNIPSYSYSRRRQWHNGWGGHHRHRPQNHLLSRLFASFYLRRRCTKCVRDASAHLLHHWPIERPKCASQSNLPLWLWFNFTRAKISSRSEFPVCQNTLRPATKRRRC